ncbi:MAG: hypothetical protein U0X93_16415 [Anaerolineales bacterium]
METITHYYSSRITSILFWWINLFGLYFIFGSLYVGFSSWFTSIIGNVFGFLFLFIWGLLFLLFGNMFPEVITDEDGLLVRFLFWRFRVKWQDIVEAEKNSFLSLAGNSRYVIKTRSLTLLHRFYGLYALSFSPSFMIRSNIKDFSLLLKRIQERKFNIK